MIKINKQKSKTKAKAKKYQRIFNNIIHIIRKFYLSHQKYIEKYREYSRIYMREYSKQLIY
jgi:hypothetical protein